MQAPINLKTTTAFIKICKMKDRVKVIQGSMGAGKTYSILMRWILMALRSKEAQDCLIVSGTVPQLKLGAVKDFETICKSMELPIKMLKNPYRCTIGKWNFQFKSVVNELDVVGGRRERLFMNEALRVPYKTARQLIGRTHGEVLMDFNATRKFWAHEKYKDINRGEFLKLTFNDNEHLPETEKEAILIHAPDGKLPDKNFWEVYGLGNIGSVEGKILNYTTFETLPEAEYQEAIGVDFGSTDPMAVVKVYVNHKTKELFWIEIFYASKVRITEVATAIKESPHYKGDSLICDHSPMLIRDLRDMGLPSFKANKKGGLKADIMFLKQYKLNIHEDSFNLLKEADYWKYQTRTIGGDDVLVEYPDQQCEDHLLDAARYATKFACI